MGRFRFSIPPILCKRIVIGNWLPNLDSDFSSEKRKSKWEGYTTLIAIYTTQETRGGSSKILIYFCGYWNCNLFLYVSNGATAIATYFHRMAYTGCGDYCAIEFICQFTIRHQRDDNYYFGNIPVLLLSITLCD